MSREYDEELSDSENLCNALHAIAYALRDLGFGGNRTNGPGAIEGHTMMLRDEIVPLISDALEKGLAQIADAVEARER